MYVLNNNVTHFTSFGVEHIPKEIKIFIEKSVVVTNIFRTQAYDPAMCGCFLIEFIDFILAGKNLLIFFHSLNSFNKNDDIILKYFITNV